jgi:hypothetical protein
MSTHIAQPRAGFPTPATCTKILLDCILAFRPAEVEADRAFGPIQDEQSNATPQTKDVDCTKFAADA